MRDYLDNVTNNSATSSETGQTRVPLIDEETGEILRSYNPLIKWELHAAGKEILMPHRIVSCCSCIRPDYLKDKKALEIRGGIDRNPYYVGFMVCGSVWVCPVCAAKIQAYRALEIRQAIDAHLAYGGSVWMVTQTVPHTKHDFLNPLLKAFAKSFHSFKSSRKWRDIKCVFNISGYIKALEVTWGSKNGWHPHSHTIFFLDVPQSEVDVSGLHSDMFAHWSRVTSKNGFDELASSAFTVQDASKVKDYLNKLTGERYSWGAEDELTKLHTKKAKGESFAPFDFLRAYSACPDPFYASLFKEYAEAFHGKMHLTWSKGLKARYVVSEKSDVEIAYSVGEEDIVLATIDFTQWKQLRKLPFDTWRGEILLIVKEHGQSGLNNYLKSLGIWSARV